MSKELISINKEIYLSELEKENTNKKTIKNVFKQNLYQGELGILKDLVEIKGLKIDTGEKNPLFYAHFSKNLELMKWLVDEQHVDINFNVEANNLLHMCGKSSDCETIKWLIKEKGFAPGTFNPEGYNSLHIATVVDDLETFKFLVNEYKMDRSVRTGGGETIEEIIEENSSSEIQNFTLNQTSDDTSSSIEYTKQGEILGNTPNYEITE